MGCLVISTSKRQSDTLETKTVTKTVATQFIQNNNTMQPIVSVCALLCAKYAAVSLAED